MTDRTNAAVEGGMYTLNAVSLGAAAGTAAIAAGIGRRCPHGRDCHRLTSDNRCDNLSVNELSFASLSDNLYNGDLVLKRQTDAGVTKVSRENGWGCFHTLVYPYPFYGFPYHPGELVDKCYTGDGVPGIGSKFCPNDFTPLHEVTALNSPECPAVPYKDEDYPVTKECIGQSLLGSSPSLVLWHDGHFEYLDPDERCARALADLRTRKGNIWANVNEQCRTIVNGRKSAVAEEIFFGPEVGTGRNLFWNKTWR